MSSPRDAPLLLPAEQRRHVKLERKVSCSLRRMDLWRGKPRGGGCGKTAIYEIHIFPHGAPKTDQKLTDNLLSPSLPQRPSLDTYSSGYPPVITEHLQGEVGSETDV